MRLILVFALLAPLLSFSPKKHNCRYSSVEFHMVGDQEIVGDILNYVNAHRKSVGLKPLRIDDFESAVAARHSQNMATGKLPFGHKDLKKRMDLIEKHIGYISATGENVATGQMTAREAVDGWLKSPGHRRNIEGDFSLTGIGVAKDRKGVVYFTQIFTK